MTGERLSDILRHLPERGDLDLTHRCNNACRHCWLWTADDEAERARELSTGEWRDVIDQARALGTREWGISGGEPMLRPDFAEIFEHATGRATGYTLNTNGTLLTADIARLLRRPGDIMVAVYGATAGVNDRVTRAPGSFEALMEGIARLKEAGVRFTVQLVPMRENIDEWPAMVELAKSLSERWRVGAAWLHLSACASAARNAEIVAQRLEPSIAVALDPPAMDDDGGDVQPAADDPIFARCVATRRTFHVDPYGGMSWCGSVKDPALRYDLRAGAPAATAAVGGGAARARGVAPGAVATAWEEFLPSAAELVKGGPEYAAGCGSCELRGDCRWCGVFGYLEHGRYDAKVEYLCELARESRAFKQRHASAHRRYFGVGGLTVRVDADLPIDAHTFAQKFRQFELDGPPAGRDDGDLLVIHHHFSIPDLSDRDLGEPVYRQAPWAIYRTGGSWIYLGISDDSEAVHRVAVFNEEHTRVRIYNDAVRTAEWVAGGLPALTMFPSDQIMFSRVLADRAGCVLHSGGVAVGGKGLLFVGHSEAGKSTTMELLDGRAEVLCDDRNIVRREPGGGFRVYGTWSHGTVPIVSGASAPLAAILFLTQSPENRIEPLEDRAAAVRRLLATLIRPFVTGDWWEKSLDVIERLAAEVPCYTMHFDKSGAIVPLIEALAAGPQAASP